ncbi:MAG: glycosyltransferase family 1 protein [Clostridiales bacterium]|nr:glycosyltransferase family 1 protein [Clostridiales bacterium]
MRYNMICIGSTGDVRPYVLLARELTKRGHDVGICAFENFRDMILQEGFRFLPLTGDVKLFMSNLMKPGTNGIAFLKQVKVTLEKILSPFLADLEAACQDCDVIVSTYLGTVIQSMAEVRGVPFIQTHYFPMDPNTTTPISSAPGQRVGRGWNLMTYQLAYLLINILERWYLADWRKQHGMSPRKLQAEPNYYLNGHLIPVLYAISPLLMPRPRSWGENIHMTGFWLDDQQEDFTPDEELAAFLNAGPKPVYIGFGSMTSGDMGETLNIVLEAIERSGVRAVLSTGWGDVQVSKNKNVYVVGYVPHAWLFEHVAAVVHHGGAGTTAAGILAGRPTLVIPFGGDQPFWAMRVRMLGLGPKPIRREKLTASKLARALKNLVTVKAYRVAAREVGERLRSEQGTVIAANIIEHEVRKWLREDDAWMPIIK